MTPEQYDVPRTEMLSLTETYLYGCSGVWHLVYRSGVRHCTGWQS